VLALMHWEAVLPTKKEKPFKENKGQDVANDVTTITSEEDIDFCECLDDAGVGTHHSTAASSSPLGLPIAEFPSIAKPASSATTTYHPGLPIVNSSVSKTSSSTTTTSPAKRDLEAKDQATETEEKQIKRRHTV
jgi:hypothetical protein